MSFALSVVFSFLFSSVPASSVGAEFIPNAHPALNVPRISSAIKIDGRLDDRAWLQATRADNFSEYNPDNLTEPPVKTSVLVAYDDSRFYMAFIALDDPRLIRVSVTDRDEAWQDDNVGIILDTYGDGAWAYEIFCNAVGIQGDIRWTNGNEDTSFDLVFESAGAITDSGYQVEMAIPFKNLRFPNKPSQTWRATFWRNHPRAVRGQYTWSAIDRNVSCFPCQFGTLTGIENVRPGRDMALLPSVTGYQTAVIRDDNDANSGLRYDKVDGRLSLGARYSLSSSSTLEATWKPDFSQVESDVSQIDINSTFALFYPEHRPFFQEGADLFMTPIDAVYTRSINDPIFAAKIVGRMGRTSLAYLGGRDQHSPIILPFEESSEFILAGKSNTNIVRLKETFLEDSFVGGLITTRIYDGGGSGSLGGIDSRINFANRYILTFQALLSRTEEPDDSALTADIEQATFDGGRHTAAFDNESYWGQAYLASFYRDAKFWSFSIDYNDESPTFRADNGFVTGNNSRTLTMWQGITFYPNKRLLTQFTPNINGGLIWNYAGLRKDGWVQPELSFLLVGQTDADISYLWSSERFHGILFDKIRRLYADFSSNFSDPVKLGFNLNIGRFIARNLAPPVLGNGAGVGLWAILKPWSRFIITPEYDYSILDYPDGRNIFEGYILRTKFNYQFTRELMTRFVVQYDDFDRQFDLEPLLSYKLNAFTIFYVGSTHSYQIFDGHDNMTEVGRQFFLKFQYLVGI